MNRNERRRRAARDGIPWARAQQEHYFREGAKRAEENIALRMTPEEAREALAKWAARPGRTQAEVDALNAAAARGGRGSA